jgi:hypothetical protein
MNRLAMNRPALALFVLSALAAAVASPAHAENVRITVTGTVATASPGMGYTVGDPVSFFWVVNDYAPQTPFGSINAGLRMSWDYNGPANPQLFASAGGTGLAGTFEPGSYSYFMTYSSGKFEIEYDGTPTGLYLAASPSTSLNYNFLSAVLTAPGFSGFPVEPTLPNPTTYLADYFGTYSIGSSTGFEMQAGSLIATFTPTGLTIAPVPEPATWALALVGLACGGSLVWRRRPARLLANGET